MSAPPTLTSFLSARLVQDTALGHGLASNVGKPNTEKVGIADVPAIRGRWDHPEGPKGRAAPGVVSGSVNTPGDSL